MAGAAPPKTPRETNIIKRYKHLKDNHLLDPTKRFGIFYQKIQSEVSVYSAPIANQCQEF